MPLLYCPNDRIRQTAQEWFARVLGEPVTFVPPGLAGHVDGYYDIVFCCTFYESRDCFKGLRSPLRMLSEHAGRIVVVLLLSATVDPDAIRAELCQVFAWTSTLDKIRVIQAGPCLNDDLESKLKDTVSRVKKEDEESLREAAQAEENPQEPPVSETVKSLWCAADVALDVASRTDMAIATTYVAYQLTQLRVHISNPATVHKDYVFRAPKHLHNLKDIVDLMDEQGVDCSLEGDVYRIPSGVWLRCIEME